MKKMTREELLEQAKAAAIQPGCYFMKDEHGVILYIGKAKNLKNRLMTYFQPALHEITRTEMMVRLVSYFETILTETEAEALILEATLIKKHKPKYNVRLKDDKSYPYIRIRYNEEYPKLEWTRKVTRDEGVMYFGPFPSAWSARQVMRLLTETFRLRDCSDNTFRHRSRPCILYQMGKCSAPCVQHISQPDYIESVRAAARVLEGKSNDVQKELERGMLDAAENEEFELAAEFRDQIQNLKIVTELQAVQQSGEDFDQDVIAIARKDSDAHGAIVMIRGGKLQGVRHYTLDNMDSSIPDGKLLSEFLIQHYSDGGQEKEEGMQVHYRKRSILVAQVPDDVDLISKALGLEIAVPDNEVEERLSNVANVNAEHALEMFKKQNQGHGIAALEEIQDKLHLDQLPIRVECYDISNISGDDAVASRVVFVEGAPDKNLYRRYKIKTVQGSNDFAMMKEVLGRRFAHVDDPFPQLVVVDGGKGQLAQAMAIMEELNIQGVPVVGLAKARTEKDFEATEVKSSMERVFLPNRKNPVMLYPNTGAFKLLTHLRDEAHRFAITYHRKVRDKRIIGGRE